MLDSYSEGGLKDESLCLLDVVIAHHKLVTAFFIPTSW